MLGWSVVERWNGQHNVACMGSTEMHLQSSVWETWRNETAQDWGVGGRIILKYIIKKLDERLDWINLVLSSEGPLIAVNTVLNFSIL
jgi:hypothetical protein